METSLVIQCLRHQGGLNTCRAQVLSWWGNPRSHMPHNKTTKDTQIRSHSELRVLQHMNLVVGVAVYHLIQNSGKEEIF